MRLIFPLLLGLGGASILCALGIWQLQRLEWKEAKLAEIQSRISEDPVALPADPTEDENEYQSVQIDGTLIGPEIHVLTSEKRSGPGFRVIRAFTTSNDRKILVDLGFIPEADKDVLRETPPIKATGNLLWPDEIDGFTPDPNTARNIWFARETATMASTLGTEPVLVVLRSVDSVTGTTPRPVTVNISNDHLEYAITWFSLMVVWIGMTGFLLWRIKTAES